MLDKKLSIKIMILLLLLLSGTAVLFVLKTTKPKSETTSLTNNTETKAEPKESYDQTPVGEMYGMTATSASGSTAGSAEWLIAYINNYPNVTDEEKAEYEAIKSKLKTMVQDFEGINPQDLNAWWQATFYILTTAIKSQVQIADGLDLSKAEKDSVYKTTVIRQLEKNIANLAYIDGLISKFTSTEYPQMYKKYDVDIVGSKFEGLPEVITPPHYPYFGLPIDIDNDGKFETVFYTTKYMNKVPNYAYIVKDDYIIFESPEGASASIEDLENESEPGFYFTEKYLDIAAKDQDRLYTKYSYKDGIISKVGQEVREAQ